MRTRSPAATGQPPTSVSDRTVRAIDCEGANLRRNSSVAMSSSSGSRISRSRSCGFALRCTSVDPVRDVVVSTPPAISRNITDTRSSSVNGCPAGSTCATRWDITSSVGSARRAVSSSRIRPSNQPSASPPLRARSLPGAAEKMSCTGPAMASQSCSGNPSHSPMIFVGMGFVNCWTRSAAPSSMNSSSTRATLRSMMGTSASTADLDSSGLTSSRYRVDSGGSSSMGYCSRPRPRGMTIAVPSASGSTRAEENVSSSRAIRAMSAYLVVIQKPP